MSFVVTTAVKKMLRMTGNKKVIQGSTSSGKTYGIIPIIADKCLSKPRQKWTVVAETLPALKDGAIDIFKNFMMDEGRWNDAQWNGTDFQYTFKNGSKIQFKSFDSVGKAKAAGKRDGLFINEANHVAYDIADALIIRSNEVWLDFNADMEFWAHTEILTQPDAEFLKLTYLDNEGIPDAVLNNLMQRKAKAEQEERSGVLGYWWNWWQVYGLGEIGRLQEAVYPRWEVLDEKPERFTRFIYGLDFGFQHPTALVRVWFWENELFVEEVIYESGLTSGQLIERMRQRGVESHIEIMADHARPEMISDISNAGFYVLNADKSVEKGINFVNEMTVLVHKDSLNIQRENRLYKRKIINGQVTEHIDKKNDDAMDCFVASTLITTQRGEIPIVDVIPFEDYALTSEGWKLITDKFSMGVKQVYQYSMLFDTFSLSLTSTNNHLIKTSKGWKEICKLKSGMTVYHTNYSTVKSTSNTQESVISHNISTTCTTKCGNTTKVKGKKDSTFITLTGMPQTTALKIWKKLNLKSTYQSTQKNGLKNLLNGLKIFSSKVLNLPKNGIRAKREKSGTDNTLLNVDSEILTSQLSNVRNVEMNLNQRHTTTNIAQTNVSLHSEENRELITCKNCACAEILSQSTSMQKQKLVDVKVLDSWSEEVYDITVQDAHEFFANGILVHNCIRYAGAEIKEAFYSGAVYSSF